MPEKELEKEEEKKKIQKKQESENTEKIDAFVPESLDDIEGLEYFAETNPHFFSNHFINDCV